MPVTSPTHLIFSPLETPEAEADDAWARLGAGPSRRLSLIILAGSRVPDPSAGSYLLVLLQALLEPALALDHDVALFPGPVEQVKRVSIPRAHSGHRGE